jgi:hypothetical protein
VLDRVRDEVRPDEPVRGVAADEEAAREKPEVARAYRLAKRRRAAVLCPHRRGDHGRFAHRFRSEVRGPVAHQHRDGQDCHRDRDEHEPQCPPPARVDRQRGHCRNEHELTRAGGRTERADDHAAMRAEPPVRDGRAEHAADSAGADADRQTPEQVQLPELAGVHKPEQSGGDQQLSDEHHAPRAESIDERTAQRTAETERQDAQ